MDQKYPKDTWPLRRRNRPIAPNGRRGQPLDVLTTFSRDAVGIVIFGGFLLVVYRGLNVALLRQNPRRGWIAGCIRSKTAWLFVSRRRVPCVSPPRFWSCVG